MRRNGEGNKRVTVKIFPYTPHIIVDFRVFYFQSEPELPTRYGICLNFNEWQCFKQKYKEITNGSTKINVDSMKPIIYEILKEKVFEMAKENCHGCSFDHPSQKQHMNMGCLSPWSELRDVYIEKCFEEISVEDVLRRYALQTTDDLHGWRFFKALQSDPE